MRRLAMAMAVALLCASVSPATTLRVPEDYPTVLKAVDLAMPGDTVEVGPGTWKDTDTRVIVADNGVHVIEACAFPRGGVVIRGSGAGVTTLDVGGPGDTVVSDVAFIQRGGEGPLTLEGMTFTGVSVGEGVIGLYSDGLEIRSCLFKGLGGADGRAVDASECPLTMVDCDVIGYTSASIVNVDYTTAELSGCRFEANVGRCVVTYSNHDYYPVLIQDCEFVRNRGSSYVCVNLQSTEPYVIERCLFLENVAETGSGAGVRTSGSTGEIRFSVFAYDSCYASTSGGAGIRTEASNTSVLNNTFVGCYSVANGAAFAGVFGGVADFRGNVSAYCPLGAAVHATSTVIMDNACNLYWENASNYGNWTPDSTDIFSDPLFCDLENLDFTVHEGSPCVDPPTPSCAPIGALGAGCGMVAVEPSSFGRIKAMFR